LSREEENKPGSKEQRSLTQPRKLNTNCYSLSPTNIKNAECFYIEIWNDSEEEDVGEATKDESNKVEPPKEI